jgi:hypothetical protein
MTYDAQGDSIDTQFSQIIRIFSEILSLLIFTYKQCKKLQYSNFRQVIFYSVTIPEAAYIQLRRRPPEDEQGNARNMYRILINVLYMNDHLCGLVVRVSGYRYRGPGFDFRRYQIFWVVVGLERGPLSLVRSIEELLEWKEVAAPGLENRD